MTGLRLCCLALVVVTGSFSTGVAAEPDVSGVAVDWTAVPWSFRPIVAPSVPDLQSAWPRDDVDRFVLARLEKPGLAPNPDADRPALIRRIAFDLTGLPPQLQEVAAFVQDPDGDDEALARVVDAYLASPRFGERWGRHWLDIARYGDSTGRTWNAPLTYAWRYRDWVIDALNADIPYDQFITQQIAGDLLPAQSAEASRRQRIATGFLALGSLDLQSLSHEQFVLDGVDDQIDVTTRALLGLSVSCARCHDHKYDPVTMRDYYALAGIFYSTRTLPGVAHQRESGGEGYVHPSKLLALPALDGLQGEARLPPGVHSMGDYQDEWRTGQRKILFTTAENVAIGVESGEARDCELRVQGEPHDRGPAPPRGDVRIPGLPRLPAIAADENGRLELARWITSDVHPLTSRVIANRIWQHLFGAGLVRTVDDFGVSSEPPTHPELLDHLAWTLRHDGWSLKRLIRKLVLSRTYRQSSAGGAAGHAADPDNTLYWRMNLRRLEFEPLRDSLLHVAGRLSPERPYGIQVAGIGGKSRLSQVASLLPIDSPYRTVYLPVIRSRLPEEFTLFDFPDPCLLLGQREVTTVSPQALFFLNSDFVVDSSRQTAERLMALDFEKDSQRIDWVYERLVARPASDDEVIDSLKLLLSLEPEASEPNPELYRWSVLIQGILASAEFRYIR